jgi:hypothetical protein
MTLKIHELLARDPRQDGLANDGQARIRNEHTVQADNELKAELSLFVCDGQYGQAMSQILSEYLKHLPKDRQLAAWISGFYGSGKSHLLKMLGHLWQNTEFSDGSTARGLVVGLPAEVAAQLRELDQSAKRRAVPLFAAMGQLPAGSGEFVRATIATIVLEACKLPTQVQLAEFVFWLRKEGIEELVRKEVEAAGKNWLNELESLYVSPLIAKAVLQGLPKFAHTEADARKAFAVQFPALKEDIKSARFVTVIRQALSPTGDLPIAVIVLDEIQQYIADSVQRAADVTEAIETLYTQFDSRLLVIGAGQSALAENTPTLVRLRDRFAVTIQLSDKDVEAVTRKVVLAKKPVHEQAIKDIYEQYAGELARHLKASPQLSVRPADGKIQVVDYPLLPTRRRFWEACFRALDAQGTHSQLRSQLKVLYQAVLECSGKPIGHVIPADALYTAIADKLVNTGVLLHELFDRIEGLDDKTPEGQLRRRACGLVFLIMKLPRESGVDLGVRATAEVIADLMVEDLTVPSAAFRSEVERILAALEVDRVLMKVAGEYRLQTTEGAEWDRVFRERVAQLTSQPEAVEETRSRRFRELAQAAVSEIKIKQGSCKEPRNVSLHYDNSLPSGTQGVEVWIRDGWSASEKDVVDAARAGGIDESTIYVFLPKKEADALRRHLVDVDAAKRTLDNKGVPANREGEEARLSIASRMLVAENAANETLKDIFRGARVFQGGGVEVSLPSLSESLIHAATASVTRRYSRFGEADFSQWETVIQRARSGNDAPFEPVGHSGSVDEHVVSREVLRVIGTGSSGNKIHKELNAPPFGWPKDAIAAALIAMHRWGFIKATRNGSVLASGALDQASVPTTDFKREHTVVTAQQKITVRGVCTHCKCPAKAGDEEVQAAKMLREFEVLAKRAGGDAPAPVTPSMTVINKLLGLSGADLLVAIAAQADELKALWDAWNKQASQLAARFPAWQVAQRLAAQGSGLPAIADARLQLKAIESGRSLLNEPDPVAPVVAVMTTALRAGLHAASEAHAGAVAVALKQLDSESLWKKLDPSQCSSILETHSIAVPSKPNVGTGEELLAALEATSLDARQNMAPLVAARVSSALAQAVKLVTPSARRFAIAPVTLTTGTDVETWLEARRTELLEGIKAGPVILG